MTDEHRINLRLPPEIFEAIDRLRKRAPGKVSRNTWMAQAIQEKIDRDSAASEERDDVRVL
jgi:metal-responsive CopG/Arc/MetJ family transcriptional regulator